MSARELEAMRREAPLLVAAHFDGETYEESQDQERLNTQLWRVFQLMRDGQWRTITQIATSAGGSEARCHARLRDLRKERFGSHTVERKRRSGGLFEYRLLVSGGGEA